MTTILKTLYLGYLMFEDNAVSVIYDNDKCFWFCANYFYVNVGI